MTIKEIDLREHVDYSLHDTITEPSEERVYCSHTKPRTNPSLNTKVTEVDKLSEEGLEERRHFMLVWMARLTTVS